MKERITKVRGLTKPLHDAIKAFNSLKPFMDMDNEYVRKLCRICDNSFDDMVINNSKLREADRE